MLEDQAEKPRILVIQDDFVSELRLALESSGRPSDDAHTIRQQITAILESQSIAAAIVDAALEREAADHIADALLELDIPFVFAGRDNQAEIPDWALAPTMTPELANLTMLAQSILGRPTCH